MKSKNKNNKIKKVIFIMGIFLFLNSYLQAQFFNQEKYKKYDSVNCEVSLCGELITSTFYKEPIFSGMISGEVFVDNSRFSIITRAGFWKVLDNSLNTGNYRVFQMGLAYTPNKNITIGSFLANRIGDYPRPYIAPISYGIDPFYLGYSNPLSLFVRINAKSIIKTGFFSKSSVFFEGNYYGYYHTGAFKITLSQNIVYFHKKNK